MNRRIVAALGALAVSGAAIIGLPGIASASALTASQMDCNNAAALTAAAQANFTNQLAVVTARLKELGVTANTITQGTQLLNSGTLTAAMKLQLLQMVYAEHVQNKITGADVAKAATLLDDKAKLDGARAVQNAACIGFTPMVVTMPAPVTMPTTTPAPAATPAPVATPAMPMPMRMVPLGAPATGDGTSLSH